MKNTDNKTIVRRFLEEIENTGDVSNIHEFISEDYVEVYEGERVVTVYSVKGTFMDEWFGMQPTGESITFTGVNVDRISDCKIIEHEGAANLMDPLLKAGVIEKKK
jgi:predicted ester cyclase